MLVYSIFCIGFMFVIIGSIMQLFTINRKLDLLLKRINKKRRYKNYKGSDLNEIKRS